MYALNRVLAIALILLMAMGLACDSNNGGAAGGGAIGFSQSDLTGLWV